MKITAVKKLAAVVLAVTMFFVLSCNAFAETVQDSLEQRLEELLNQYNSSDSETQDSMQDQLSGFLEQAGLSNFDFGSLAETDIGQIIGDLGNNLAIEDFLELAEDAWNSGSAMIGDVINNGLGTSDGSNTATTNPSTTGSPNIIIANTNPVGNTNAVGVPSGNSSITQPSINNQSSTTAANIVGAGVTTPGTTAPAVAVDDAMSTSTIAVLVVLSVATIAVIVAIVIFFVLKRK